MFCSTLRAVILVVCFALGLTAFAEAQQGTTPRPNRIRSQPKDTTAGRTAKPGQATPARGTTSRGNVAGQGKPTTGTVTGLQAGEECQGDECEGGGGEGGDPPQLVITPDGGSDSTRVPYSTGHTATFTASNAGGGIDDFSFTCVSSDSIVCVSVSPSTTPLGHFGTSITVTYNVRGQATGQWVRLAGDYLGDPPSSDIGTHNVTIAPPAEAPVVSLAPHNGAYKNTAVCVATCFDATFSHTTPAYFRRGVARDLTVAYNSGSTGPIVTFSLDVNVTTGNTPTGYSFELKKMPAGTNLTFVNGQTTMYTAASGTQVNRVVLPINARANGLTTGGYEVRLIATAHYTGGVTKVNTLGANLIVVDEFGSEFGAGVGLAGLQRVYADANGNALVTEGDGSAAYYRWSPSAGQLATPGGTSAALYHSGDGTWTRVYLDGSTVKFNSSGRQIYQAGVLGDTTTLTWTSNQLTRIQDPTGGRIYLTYDVNGKLKQVYDSNGTAAPRRTNYTVTNGKLVRITDADSVYAEFTYDSLGHVLSLTDRAGQVSNVSYDTLRRVSVTQGPQFTPFGGGSATRLASTMVSPETRAWGTSGSGTSGSPKAAVKADTLVATLADPVGNVTRLVLDRFGQALTVTDPLGAVAIATRDTMGRLLTDSTALGAKTTYTWGVSGSSPIAFTSPYPLYQVQRVVAGQTTTSTYAYNANLDLLSVSGDHETRAWTYTSRRLSTEAVGGTTVQTHYATAVGLDTAVANVTGDRTRFSYDSSGNLLQVIAARGGVTSILRDAYGRDTATTSPLSGKSRVGYDKFNRTIRTTDPYGNEVLTTYDLLGRVTRIRDQKSQVYRFAYGPAGLSHQYDLADTTLAQTYGYDQYGRLVSTTTRRGDTITLTYDAYGRLRSRSGPDFPVDSFAYDAVGRWVTAWNANGKDSVTVDNAGRAAHASQWVNGTRWGFDYSYDKQDRLLTRARTAGTADTTVGRYTLSYSGTGGIGQLDIIEGAGVKIDVDRNNARQPNSILYHPGVGSWTATKTFNEDQQEATHSYSVSGTNNYLGGQFTFDSLGRLSNQDYNSVQYDRRFTYDSLGRMVNYCDYYNSLNQLWDLMGCQNEFGGAWPSPSTNAYKYDATGNRVLGAENTTSTYIGAGNRLARSRGWYFTYDANGNILTKCTAAPPGCTDGFKYTWNALGQLVTVRDEANDTIASFKYDTRGRRVWKRGVVGGVSDTLRFVYDGGQIVADLNGSGTLRTEYSYFPGGPDRLLGMRQSGGWEGAVLTDAVVGTVRGIAKDSTGTLIKRYQVDPWGRATTADTGVKTRFRMAGREYDAETGLYYNRARYYDPDIGRFISEDPVGVIGGLNLYAYAGNDPVNGRDPSGLDKDIGGKDCPPGYFSANVERLDGKGRIDVCLEIPVLPELTVTNPGFSFGSTPGDSWTRGYDSSPDGAGGSKGAMRSLSGSFGAAGGRAAPGCAMQMLNFAVSMYSDFTMTNALSELGDAGARALGRAAPAVLVGESMALARGMGMPGVSQAMVTDATAVARSGVEHAQMILHGPTVAVTTEVEQTSFEAIAGGGTSWWSLVPGYSSATSWNNLHDCHHQE